MTKARKSSNQALLVVPILILAFALRVHGLEHHNIWGDEAFSIALAKQNLTQVLIPEQDTHPPLYPILLHIWLRMAGDSIFAVRYLSVIPGILLVSVVYILGHRLFGRAGALLAAVLTALSSFAIYYSQETRAYAWLATFSTVSVYASLRMQNRSSPETTWVLAFLSATLASIFTHYYGLLVLLSVNLFMVLQNRLQRLWVRKWIVMQTVILLAFLPWALAHLEFIGSKGSLRLEAWGLSGSNQVWSGTLWAFGMGTTVSAQQQWLAAALLIFVAIGLRYTFQYTDQKRFLAVYLLIPFTGAWLIGPLMPFYYPRYLSAALPAYVLLLAAGLLSSTRLIYFLGLSLAVIANGISLSNYYFDPNYAKGGYGDLMAYVKQHSLSTDGLLLQNGAQAPLYNYYGHPTIRSYNLPPWDNHERQPMLDAVISKHPRIWLLKYGNPMGYDPTHEMELWLNRHAYRAYHGDYVDGSLDLYIQGGTMPTKALEAIFGDLISLTGYSLSDNSIPAGNNLRLEISWMALDDINRDYTIFVHLIDSQDQPWAMVDGQPLGGTHPTSVWTVGETVVDRIALQLDQETPTGEYRIQLGWYDLSTMDRLPAAGQDDRVLVDRVILGPVRVKER